MEDLYLSKSSIETFTQCGLKFDYRYVQKVEAVENDQEKEAATFGSLMHKVLEDHFHDKELPIMELYQKHFTDFAIKGQHFFDLGYRMITDYAKASDNGNKVLFIEKDFKLFLENGVPVKGFIDRIDEISPDEVEIIDYKTGFSRPLTPEQLKNDLQLGIYNLVIKQLFPQYKRVKLTLDYLHYGKVSVYRTPDQLDALMHYLLTVYEKIKGAIEAKEEFKPTVNSYCSFCSYRAKCKAFKEVIIVKDQKADLENYSGLVSRESDVVIPLERMDAFLENIKAKVKILKKLEDDVKAYMLEHIVKQGQDGKAKFGKTTYSSATKTYTNYNVNTVLEVFAERGIDLNEVLSPQKTAIDSYLKDDKEAMSKIRSTAKTSFSESYLK